MKPGPAPTPIADRFWPKVDRSGGPLACWPWLAAIGPDGYGRFRGDVADPGRVSLAHRVAFELLRGPIPEGLQIDHLCRNRACVNPAHMETVTSAENTRRGAPATKTHCVHGHPYDAANTYQRPARPRQGVRGCRTCNRLRLRELRARRRAA